MPSRKRDNVYYLGLVETRAPHLYARYRAGEFKSAAEVIRLAGVKTAPKAINDLRRAWKAASAADRATFVAEIGLTLTVAAPAAAPARTTVVIYGLDGCLTPEGARRIQEIMDKRGLWSRTGAIMKEIGFDPRNTSLGTALARNTTIQPALAAALQSWVDRH